MVTHGLGICTLVLFGTTSSVMSSTAPPSRSEPAQDTNRRAIENAEMSKAVADILQAASSAPPQLEALTILRVIDSGQIRDRNTKIDLLRRAFDVAYGVQYPLRKRRVLITKEQISPPEYILSSAMRHGVDRLSLQIRASKATVDIDAHAGRQLFEEISFSMPSVSCEEILVSDVSLYYATAASIVNHAFSAKQRARNDDVALVRTILSRVQSPMELAPAASMLAALQMHQRRSREVVNDFASVLQRINGDDRSFTASLLELDTALRKKLLPSLPGEDNLAGTLLKEYRRYVVRHLTASRCVESVNNESPLGRQESAVLRGYSGEEALTEEERKPTGSGGAAKLRTAFPHLESLAPQIHRLFPLDPSQDKQREAMKTQPWRTDFYNLLREVADLEPSIGQSEAGLSHERLRIAENILRIAPRSSERDTLLERYILWLKQSPLQSESWVEWYDAVSCLVVHADAQEREKILALFEASGQATLVLIASIEKTL